MAMYNHYCWLCGYGWTDTKYTFTNSKGRIRTVRVHNGCCEQHLRNKAWLAHYVTHPKGLVPNHPFEVLPKAKGAW